MQQEGIPLAFLPDRSVARRLDALGRTEDVKFSPDGRRLAIAGFTANTILIIEIAPIVQGGVLTIASRTCIEITCEALVSPHGLAWIDDGAMIVANRQRGVAVIPVPQRRSDNHAVRVQALLEIFPDDSTSVHTPGSVVVSRLVDSNKHIRNVALAAAYIHLPQHAVNLQFPLVVNTGWLIFPFPIASTQISTACLYLRSTTLHL